jgi:hypothetical protein
VGEDHHARRDGGDDRLVEAVDELRREVDVDRVALDRRLEQLRQRGPAIGADLRQIWERRV